MTDNNDTQDTVLAAEYALGIMSAEESAAFEARLIKENALRAEYNSWTEYFTGLSDEVPSVTPPAHLKADIQKRLFGNPTTEKASSSWFNFRWASGLAFACILGVMLFVLKPIHFTPTYTAQLTSTDQTIQVTALYDLSSQSLKMTNFSGTPATGRDFELWAIIGDNAPVSLGVMASLKGNVVTVPKELAESLASATLALSDEPLGGSPTGSPTGKVLVAATVQAI